MTKLTRPFILSLITILVLTACIFTGAEATSEVPQQIALATAALSPIILELNVQADTSVPFTTVGQTIKYTYNIKNVGTASTPGPVTVPGAICPALNTTGNLNDTLDVSETIACNSTYTITQTDLDKGSVMIVTTANVNGINSNQVTTTVSTAAPVILKLTKTASPATYDRVGQTITYTYVITNSGAATLGPAQFTVTDTGLIAPIACGEATLTLASNLTVTCSATYTITQADMNAASVATTATAAGGGVAPSQPASATITKSAASNPANLTSGSTITHKVVEGEWLWQIARCYGADPSKVVAANPQLANPAEISPNTTVTVPNIGSAGKIYGPPCVGTHTVQTGDTWASIALKYNADANVLQMVNKNTIAVGTVLKVPLNSASTTTTGTVIPVTGTTSTCVDLIRSFRLVGSNPSPTHFNICGFIDATGKTKILTINISQLPADVPVNAISQNITVLLETSTPLTETSSLIVGDINYDGNDDFRIVRNVPAGPNIPYLYYIYDPSTRQFIYSSAYENITSPEFPGNSEIRSQWRDGAAKWGISTFTVANNTPRLTKQEIWQATSATQATHTVTLFNADGTSQVIVNEVVPIPAQ